MQGQWRTAWKGKNGQEYFGDWCADKEMVMAWVEQSNKDFPEILHWCEPKRAEEQPTAADFYK